MAKEGSTVSGLMDSFRDRGLALAAAWRAAEGAVREVRAHPLRAFGLDRQRADRLRQVHHGLHLPLAAVALPLRPAAVAVCRAGCASGCNWGAPSLAHSELGGLHAGGEPRLGLTADQHQPTRGMGAAIRPRAGSPRNRSRRMRRRRGHPVLSGADRGVIHAADAMRSMYDMGDAPSCHTCGAIMVRNGSCYRCMSCGSTSGCS